MKTSLVELEMMKVLLHKKLAKIELQINQLRKGELNEQTRTVPNPVS